MKNALKIASAVLRTLAKDASLYNALINEVRPVVKDAFREMKQALVESDLNASSTELELEFKGMVRNAKNAQVELRHEVMDLKTVFHAQLFGRNKNKGNGTKPTVVPPPADA